MVFSLAKVTHNLPAPPMLMFDRVTNINETGGLFEKGEIVAELDIKPELWFFDCHFKGDPVMPGCLGLDAMWQLVGFYLGWLGQPGKGRALGVGEVKFTGQVLNTVKKVTYHISLKRLILRKLILGVADGILKADGEPIYEAKDMKVGLFQSEEKLNMRRVVVTGLGIVSCIGNDAETVTNNLKNLNSGISSAPEYEEFSFRSLVHGKPEINLEENIDRRLLRFMGDGAAFNYIAMKNAIEDSGLEEIDISNEMTGIIVGSGGPSTMNLYKASELGKNSGSKKVGPFMVPRSMSSTNSATLATPFKIKGVNYSITSACSTSSHCIGNAYELIQMGKQNIIFAGGGEELHWTLSILFDAMGALSSKYNDNPKIASRAYDSDRDGFVISGGGGTLVLEELEHAKARGAKIYGEITGYGATSDGFDMVQPSGEGAERCMKMAIKNINGKVDYINSHGTSTPIGDIKELEAIKNVFGNNIPKISSTKSLTGHSLGATGVHEAIYCLLMLNNNFLSGSANIKNLDEKAKNHNILLETEENHKIKNVLSNSFGFGGTNATLLMSRYNA